MQKEEGEILEVLNVHPHENVIQLLDIIEYETDILMVFPLMEHSLDIEIFNEEYEYDAQRTKAVMAMVLKGVEHIHQEGIIHRDLKPENILIEANGTAKLADFGLSKLCRPNEYFMGIYGTKPYIAPEQYLKFGSNEKCDIWVRTFVTNHYLLKLFRNLS